MKSFFVRVKSSDCLTSYPSNSASSFTVNLPIRLYLNGPWRCGLSEITYPRIKNIHGQIHVLSDFTNESVMGELMLPILRRFPNTLPAENTLVESVREEFRHVQYIKVTKESMLQMTFRLRDDSLNPVVFENHPVYLTLHFLQL